MKNRNCRLLRKSVIAILILLQLPLLGLSGTSNSLASVSTNSFEARGNSSYAIADSLTAGKWYWKSYSSTTDTVTIDQPKAYELTFGKDGGLSVVADCNRANGSYKVDGSSLTVTLGPSTTAVCPENSRSEQFLQLLSKAQKFVSVGTMLILTTQDNNSLVFSLPSIVDLCGEKVLTPSSIVDTIDPKISSDLDKVLVGFVSPSSMPAPGASMLVITPEGQYFKSAGLSDVAACAPLRADAEYQIGSNTKLMTSAIVYQLQESGKLSTSDKIGKYLPEIAAKLKYGDEITIEMLLTHTSGLLDYFDVDKGDGGIAAGANNKSILTRGYKPEELVNLVADSGSSNFKPGEAGKWKYCNTGYILLGMIIEKITKKSYEANLRSRIFKRLNLKKTYLQRGQPDAGVLPQAYYQPPFTFTTSEWNASQGWSAGAVVSTSREFAVFLRALFTGKLFKNKSTLGLISSIPTAGVDALGKGMSYGHGLLNIGGVLGHGGQTLGFQSDGGYIPEKDMTIVFWSNSASNGVTRTAVPRLTKILLGRN